MNILFLALLIAAAIVLGFEYNLKRPTYFSLGLTLLALLLYSLGLGKFPLH